MKNKKKLYLYWNLEKTFLLVVLVELVKQYLIKYFVEHYKNVKNIGLTSTTGISAGTIGGTTINSFLGIGLGKSTSMKLAKKLLIMGF